MTLQTIESKDVSLGDLFANFFVVPNFQREYVWGTDEVRQLLEDVYAEYSDSDRNTDSEYFIGTIVTCVGDNAVYQLIDGQQRMTTSYLVLCAIRDYMKQIQGGEIQALTPQIAATSVDRKGRDVFRYRVALQYATRSLLDRRQPGNYPSALWLVLMSYGPDGVEGGFPCLRFER